MGAQYFPKHAQLEKPGFDLTGSRQRMLDRPVRWDGALAFVAN
jgi:hypothetical protein